MIFTTISKLALVMLLVAAGSAQAGGAGERPTPTVKQGAEQQLIPPHNSGEHPTPTIQESLDQLINRPQAPAPQIPPEASGRLLHPFVLEEDRVDQMLPASVRIRMGGADPGRPVLSYPKGGSTLRRPLKIAKADAPGASIEKDT